VLPLEANAPVALGEDPTVQLYVVVPALLGLDKAMEVDWLEQMVCAEAAASGILRIETGSVY
jgi:hypothetical protein